MSDFVDEEHCALCSRMWPGEREAFRANLDTLPLLDGVCDAWAAARPSRMLDCRVSFYLLQTTFVSISKIDSILARLSIGQIRGLHDGAVPEAGEVRAQFISAQLKTKKTGNFSEETAETFSFICDQRDLDYWSPTSQSF
jgi:hypothetical protein